MDDEWRSICPVCGGVDGEHADGCIGGKKPTCPRCAELEKQRDYYKERADQFDNACVKALNERDKASAIIADARELAGTAINATFAVNVTDKEWVKMHELAAFTDKEWAQIYELAARILKATEDWKFPGSGDKAVDPKIKFVIDG
jgi:hypothetical protein